MNEAEWWDRFGHLNNRIWEYDDYINSVIRQEYLKEMREFLFKPGGRLLDFGCGTGWLSLPFAQLGMVVDGIDHSEEQIMRARHIARQHGVENIRLWRSDYFPTDLANPYDAILLHALVHHIPMKNRRVLLEMIANALAPAGKLYIYDPIVAIPHPPIVAKVLDLFMGGMFRLLHLLGWSGKMLIPEIREAMLAGWTMKSPEEQPNDLNELLGLIPESLSCIKLSPWHLWSINYANFCMMLKPAWREWLKVLLPIFYRLDRWGRRSAWYPYLRCWPFVAIMAVKHE